MFVIADQGAAGVGGKRRLASAGQAKENGRVAIGADIRGTMHRHDAAFGQQIIENGENRLLDFTGIAGARNQHRAFSKIHRDHGFTAPAMTRRIGLEIRQMQDGEFRNIVRQFLSAPARPANAG